MRPLPYELPKTRALRAPLLLLALLTLASCTDSGGRNTAPIDEGSGNEPGDDGEKPTEVVMVPGVEQRNDADPGTVTKPKDDKPQSFESDLRGGT